MITLADGSEVVNFCANNYLGLANHPDLVGAAHAALDEEKGIRSWLHLRGELAEARVRIEMLRGEIAELRRCLRRGPLWRPRPARSSLQPNSSGSCSASIAAARSG